MIKRMFLVLGILSMVLSPGALRAQAVGKADFDGNGRVDFPDFLEFAGAFGSGQARYDLSGNGSVDFPDFLAFVGHFGQNTAAVSSGSTQPGTRVEYLNDEVEIEFVWIEPGSFTMGSPRSEPGRQQDESPQHLVTISRGFYLGKYEVTQRQWDAVMDFRPWEGQTFVRPDPDHPADYLSWDDAQAFIQKLNGEAGAELYRLPTEAEWECACRAGTTTIWSFGDEESRLREHAWYRENTWNAGERYAHRVGTKKPNPWGLYDMHGNVWEWVLDLYDGAYTPGHKVDPLILVGTERDQRGGAFNAPVRETRSALRNCGAPFDRYIGHGFRLVREAE